MMKFKSILRTSVLLLTFAACDCPYQISGIVLDEQTKEPISEVAIGKTDTSDLDNPFNRKSYSNINGEFDVHGIAGSCDEVTMYFSRKNYVTQKLTFHNNSIDTVFLKPKIKK